MKLHFADIFKICLEEQGYSIRKFARLTGFDRAWLTNILNKKKKLPEASFDKVINNSLFTEDQLTKLRYSFYANSFSASQFKRITHILNDFSSLRENEAKTIPMTEDVQSSLTDLLNNATFIYTNLQPNCTALISALLKHLNSSVDTPDYRHIMYYNNGHDSNNWDVSVTAMHFARLGYKVHISTSPMLEHILKHAYMPFFILTDNGIMFFSANGVFIENNKNPGVLNHYKKLFLVKHSESKCLTHISSNPVKHLLDHNNIRGINKRTINISNSFVYSPIIPTEFWPAEPSIISSAFHFLDGFHDDNNITYVTIDAIDRFVSTGVYDIFPQKMISPFTKEQRIVILKNLVDAIDSEQHNIHLINPVYMDYDFYSLETDQQSYISFATFLQTSNVQNNYLGKAEFITDDFKLIDDFKSAMNFVGHLSHIHDDEFFKKYVLVKIKELEL